MSNNKRIVSHHNQFEALRVFETTTAEEKEEVDSKLEAGLLQQREGDDGGGGDGDKGDESLPPPDKNEVEVSSRSRGGHSLDFWLSSVQRYSTFPPAAFLGLHFTNTSLIPLITRSIPESESFLLLSREIYQAPVLEHAILTAPVIAHVVSGAVLRFIRYNRRRARMKGETASDDPSLSKTKTKSTSAPAFRTPSIQARLGYALLPLLGTHVFFNRLLPLWVDGAGGSASAGLSFAAHGIARSPWLMGLGYAAFIAVGTAHFVGGAAAYGLGWRSGLEWPFMGDDGDVTSSSASRSQRQLRELRVRRWKILNGVSLATTLVWLAGGVGVALLGKEVIGSAWEVKEWNRLYEAVPVVGKYLTD